MTHFAYITHILYCTLYKLQTTCLCVKYFVKNLHRAEKIYTGGARGARDKYQVWGGSTETPKNDYVIYGGPLKFRIRGTFYYPKNSKMCASYEA